MIAKVLLRNRQTGQYYSGPSEWVGDGIGAHDFGTVENAAHLARTHKLNGMEVVLRYDDPVCDLDLPVREAW
jgi:hypothetical protein